MNSLSTCGQFKANQTSIFQHIWKALLHSKTPFFLGKWTSHLSRGQPCPWRAVQTLHFSPYQKPKETCRWKAEIVLCFCSTLLTLWIKITQEHLLHHNATSSKLSQLHPAVTARRTRCPQRQGKQDNHCGHQRRPWTPSGKATLLRASAEVTWATSPQQLLGLTPASRHITSKHKWKAKFLLSQMQAGWKP